MGPKQKRIRQKEQQDYRQTNKRGDIYIEKWDQTESPEIPDRWETSEIPGLPSVVRRTRTRRKRRTRTRRTRKKIHDKNN